MGVEIVSTGGTSQVISDQGINVVSVDTVTNFPEMMSGRVKTLHPLIFGGILARDEDSKEVEEHNLTHLPFRNWCIFCVKGKAKDDPHRRRIKQDEEQEIPIVSIDYMFMESRESRIKRK